MAKGSIEYVVNLSDNVNIGQQKYNEVRILKNEKKENDQYEYCTSGRP